MSVGANATGASPLSGKIYQAQIYNGINGTLAVDFDASRYAGGTTLTGSTGETWTLQGNAVIHPTNSPMLGYLAEGARTNLCLQSNAFNTTWLDSTTPAATQNVVGPDGATSAWTIADDDATNLEFKYQPILLTAAAYTASVFVKKTVGTQASYPVFRLSLQAGGASANCTIDTTNGIATAWTAFTGDAMLAGISASCSNYNDDFWRVSLTATATAANYVIILAPAATTNPVQSTGAWVGTVTGSAVFYGAQVELGSFASSYIPTTTVAVTRNADVLTYSSAGNIDGTVGWVYVESTVPVNNSAPQIQIDDGSNNNRILVDDGNSVNGGTRFLVQSGGGIEALINDFSSSATTFQKRCVTWATNYAQSSQGGLLSAVDASVTTPVSFTQIGVGGVNGSAVASCTIRNLRSGQRQLSQLELSNVSRP